jgi:hypothetical protein
MMFDYERNKSLVTTSTGRRLTSGLFEEFEREDAAIPAPFKLSEWRKRYVEIADPTDYQAAMELLGDWDHWQLLLANQQFSVEVEKWRKEVEVKLRSEGVARLIKHSKGPQGTAAARWLAEAGFVEGRDMRRKKDKSDADTAAKEAKSKVADDAKRLGLSLVK